MYKVTTTNQFLKYVYDQKDNCIHVTDTKGRKIATLYDWREGINRWSTANIKGAFEVIKPTKMVYEVEFLDRTVLAERLKYTDNEEDQITSVELVGVDRNTSTLEKVNIKL